MLIRTYKKKLHSCYELTDLRPVNWLLGIKIMYDQEQQTISLSQQSYIDSIIKCFSLQDTKTHAMPMVLGVIYSQSNCPMMPTKVKLMKTVPYHEAIDSLMYASIAT
jgi:hypothetical protein